MATYAIAGGGMLGMTLALRLRSAGHDVTIFESAPRCGGLAAPWRLGPVTWDRHYHVTLFSDTALRDLLGELELGDELNWVTTKTGFFVDGNLYSFSHVLDFLRFPPLSPIEKMRLGYTILAASRTTDWRELERVRAVDWLAAHSGRSTVEKIWLPLLRAKLGTYAEHASAAFIWAIIVRMYAARRTGAKRELFGYVSGGYDTVVRRFEERLTQLGVRIERSCRIDSVQQRGGRLTVLRGDREEHFDNVVITLAAPLAARLCPQLDAARTRPLRRRGIPGHRLRVDLERPRDFTLLRDEHHRSVGAFYGSYRNDRARQSEHVRRTVADLSAEIRASERPDLRAERR